MIAIPGDKARHIELCDEIIEIMTGLQDHVATAPAISSIRTAFGHKGLAPKGHTTATTVTGSGKDFHLINKHRVIISRTRKKARHEYLAMKISFLQLLVFYNLHRLDVYTALAFILVKLYATSG